MLLQTFVQLHILLAAAPTLANWVLLCPAMLTTMPAAPAQVLYLCQNAAELTTPAVQERRAASRQQFSPRPALGRHLVPIVARLLVVPAAFQPSSTTVLLGAFTPFPQATRAP